jgi:hypothetical protein
MIGEFKTSCDSTNKSITMKEPHPPDHCKALEDANLSPKQAKSPTFNCMKQECIKITKSTKDEKAERNTTRNRGACGTHDGHKPRPQIQQKKKTRTTAPTTITIELGRAVLPGADHSFCFHMT